ncbi:50S ribosomal protein L5 [Candidatus Vidania fulgoroideorum]
MYTPYLKKYYNSKINLICKELKIKNCMEIPKILKIVINVSLGILGNNYKYLKMVKKKLSIITMQKPLIIKSKKSISNFKLKENTNIALKVTLRKNSMYDFLYKFINLACPRIRDFKGFNLKSIDNSGNLNLGLNESYIFPEINKFEDLKDNFGMNISIVTNTKDIYFTKYILNFFNFPIS